MIESATGLILRTRPLTETSLIVLWLTPEFGRLATVAKGARRPKSPFAGKLDLFYRCDFNFSRSRSSELHTLREVSLRNTHARLREDLGRLRQAAYAAALIEQVTETETPLPQIAALFGRFLDHCAAGQARSQNILSFELKLLGELGLQPRVAETNLTEGAKRIAQALQSDAWPAVANLRLSADQTTELRQFLHGYLIYHLGRMPAGRAAALGGE